MTQHTPVMSDSEYRENTFSVFLGPFRSLVLKARRSKSTVGAAFGAAPVTLGGCGLF
jgi:hypothetical protein